MILRGKITLRREMMILRKETMIESTVGQSVDCNENLVPTEISLQKVCEVKGSKNLSYQICNSTDSIPISEF